MSTRISHIPFFERLLIPDWALFAAATVYALPLVALLLWKPMLAIAFAIAPMVLLLVAHGPSLIYLLVVSTFTFFPLPGSVALLPADMVAIVLIAAYAVDLLCRGRSPGTNRLARPFFAYLCVVFLSVTVSGLTALSVKFFLRQSVLFATFLAVSHFGPRMNLRNVLILFVVAANLNSIYSILVFLAAGSDIRSFGIAGQGFADHAMLAFLISVVFYLWTDDIRARVFWGTSALITAAAIAATQTRASAITAGWALIVVIILAVRNSRQLNYRTPFKSMVVAIMFLIVLAPVLAYYTPVFEGIAYRFSRMGFQATGTILLRVSLWKAALTAFWNNPLLGIGAGNFAQVSRWVPEVRFDPVFYMVTGLSTHAIFMSALAETGIVGLTALLMFFGRAIRTGYRRMVTAGTPSEKTVTQCLFLMAVVVFGSSFYAGSWFWGNNSYHMAVLFGLMASFRGRTAVVLPGGKSF